MKKYLNLFAGFIAAFFAVGVSYVVIANTIGFENVNTQKELLFNVDDVLYSIMSIALLIFIKDFINTRKMMDYSVFLFLAIIAFLREMGAQKWLATKDSSFTKIRFFTNDNNPISERIIGGLILLFVFAAILYVAIKFAPKIIKGVFKLVPLYWSVATLCGLGVLSKVLDRMPAKINDWSGERISPESANMFTFFEESIEFSLPIIVVIILLQHHYNIKKGE